MINSAMQLKAKVRNLSGSDSLKAQTLIRNFIMERFLERVALSEYRDNFILKGGMLVAAVVGLDTRATMDIDTTVKSLNLSKENAVRIVNDIINVKIPDGIQFRIAKVTDIMEEHDYPGIRFMLEASLDNLRQTIKIDISTGDIITPEAVEYTYHLMFENRSVSLWAYNIETLLAEKLETIMVRDTANTRMRDFYDIYIISQRETVDHKILKKAFLAVCEKRETLNLIPDFKIILHNIETDNTMMQLWSHYRDSSFYIGELTWDEAMSGVKKTADIVLSEN